MESRNFTLLQLRPPKGLYQPYGTTAIDRYPAIFKIVRERVEDGPHVRILSFGCSTGEEVFSLRRYFNEAKIVGYDINPFNIAICRRRKRKMGDDRLKFVVAGSTALEDDAKFDAIFAMAVFRHGDLNSTPPPSRCDHRICFADFERSVIDLARTLKPGGLLVMQYAMFRFADTSAAAGFEAALTLETAGNFPLYGIDNCVLTAEDYPEVVFRKLA